MYTDTHTHSHTFTHIHTHRDRPHRHTDTDTPTATATHGHGHGHTRHRHRHETAKILINYFRRRISHYLSKIHSKWINFSLAIFSPQWSKRKPLAGQPCRALLAIRNCPRSAHAKIPCVMLSLEMLRRKRQRKSGKPECSRTEKIQE